MQLRDERGREFALSIIEYESPDTDVKNWDWLIVEVRMRQGEIERKKRSPCLTVQEGHELADWLEGIAGIKGSIFPGMPNLTEPNLQVEILKASRDHIELRARFIFESRDTPPLFDHLDLVIGRNELKRAASDLRRELESFPPREPT